MKMLNIGCGGVYHPDWINLDFYSYDQHIIRFDITKKLKFDDNSIDVVYHSHVLEHLKKRAASNFIRECYRILKPGGIIRIAVPDLEKICQAYLANLETGFRTGQSEAIFNYQWNKIEMFDQIIRETPGGAMQETINQHPINRDYIISRNGRNIFLPTNYQIKAMGGWARIFHKLKTASWLLLKLKFSEIIRTIRYDLKIYPANLWGERHYWLYDRLDLKLLLTETGFKNFSITTYKDSRINDWNKYQLDIDPQADSPRKPDSIFVEAEK